MFLDGETIFFDRATVDQEFRAGSKLAENI
jgi:hypothetical protein